jgi:hypothetical protein
MLEASRTDLHDIDNRVFASRPSENWEQLVSESSTSDRRTMFVLAHEGAEVGHGVLWAFAYSSRPTADLGWWWVHPDAEGTSAEQSLFDSAIAWAAHLGARIIETAADDEREEASLRRAGFHETGIAADGVRLTFNRACTITGPTTA